MDIILIIAGVAGIVLSGALLGLIPFLMGKYMGKPGFGKLAMLCCTLSSLLMLHVPVTIGFVIAVIIKDRDYPWPSSNASRAPVQPRPVPQSAPVPQQATGLNLTCLSGPLRGQVYPVGREGLLLGRDPSCGVRLPDKTPGVSGQHCCIRWQQGVPVLIDLNSSYGTFQGDGRRLPPNYPVQLAAGSRFYLADTNCLFQLTVL